MEQKAQTKRPRGPPNYPARVSGERPSFTAFTPFCYLFNVPPLLPHPSGRGKGQNVMIVAEIWAGFTIHDGLFFVALSFRDFPRGFHPAQDAGDLRLKGPPPVNPPLAILFTRALTIINGRIVCESSNSRITVLFDARGAAPAGPVTVRSDIHRASPTRDFATARI